MPTDILGISAYYHDSAASLIRDGEIVAAAQEERFTRKKQDAGFPSHAIRYCLREAGISLSGLRYVVFYDKPLVKFERLLETYLAFAPSGLQSFLAAMPVWMKEKMLLKSLLQKELVAVYGVEKERASSASLCRAPRVPCGLGVLSFAFKRRGSVHGWSWRMGDDFRVARPGEKSYPALGNSVSALPRAFYSAFTYYTGFKVNSGEYKVMGLAPYGKPKYVQAIYDNLIDLKPDGTFRLNMECFNYCTGLTMTNGKFETLFGGPARKPETYLTQRDMDLARSVQEVTEEVMLRLARTLHRETGAENLCLAGGVALNCVGNGRILREGPFKGLWIQPAAGDAGGALGAALTAWHRLEDQAPRCNGNGDAMHGSLLGPSFSNEEIEEFLKTKRLRMSIPERRRAFRSSGG